MNFEGKVAVVTGGDAGIGRATALAFAQGGAKVVIGNRNEERGQQAVDEIQSTGGNAVFQKTDVSHPAEVRGLVERAVKEYSRIDFAFNNAGIFGQRARIHEQDDEAAMKLLAINAAGVLYSMKYEIAQMLQNGGGAIVNNASILGLGSSSEVSVYSASKAAVCSLSKSAAIEYAQDKIRVNCVAPGPIRTDMLEEATGGEPDSYAQIVPMARVGEAKEIAEVVVWLCSERASFVNGHIMPIDGGVTAQL